MNPNVAARSLYPSGEALDRTDAATARVDLQPAIQNYGDTVEAILEDLEAKALALRALHTKLHDLDAGESFGDVVARSRPRLGREPVE